MTQVSTGEHQSSRHSPRGVVALLMTLVVLLAAVAGCSGGSHKPPSTPHACLSTEGMTAWTGAMLQQATGGNESYKPGSPQPLTAVLVVNVEDVYWAAAPDHGSDVYKAFYRPELGINPPMDQAMLDDQAQRMYGLFSNFMDKYHHDTQLCFTDTLDDASLMIRYEWNYPKAGKYAAPGNPASLAVYDSVLQLYAYDLRVVGPTSLVSSATVAKRSAGTINLNAYYYTDDGDLLMPHSDEEVWKDSGFQGFIDAILATA